MKQHTAVIEAGKRKLTRKLCARPPSTRLMPGLEPGAQAALPLANTFTAPAGEGGLLARTQAQLPAL